MAQHLDQRYFSAAYGGVRRASAAASHPMGPATVITFGDLLFVFPSSAYVLPPQNSRNVINGSRPTYGDQYNNQDLRFTREIHSDGFIYNYIPPSTSGSYMNLNHMTNNVQESIVLDDNVQESNNNSNDNFFDFEQAWIQEDETMILTSPDDGGLSSPDDGGLSEKVISRYLKTRNSDEVRATDKDEAPKICTVCQDDLCHEDDHQMIAMLNCGHEYHSCCIKRWLQQKNICPLCKAIALPVGRR